MHAMSDRRRAVPPRSTGPVRRFRVSRALLCTLGLGLTACKDAELTQPLPPRPAPALAAVEMHPPERRLSFIGMTTQVFALRVAADGTPLGFSRGLPELFSWSSDAPDVVTVDSLGVVTAVSEGTARISARSGGFTGTATVTVRDAIREAWTYLLGGAPGEALAIAHDGTAYVSGPSTLHALGPGGQVRWGAYTGGKAHSAPAIAPDGTLYVTVEEAGASLMAIDPSGAELWTFASAGTIISSPALGSDGTIYVASRDGTLHAIDPEGRERWAFRARERFHFSSPALAHDGTIIVGAEDGLLYAIGPDGSQRWTFGTGYPIWSSPAIAPDGTIYIASQDLHLYALAPDGSQKWSLRLPLHRQAIQSPAIAADGTVYIGGSGLHAVDPSGRLRWTFRGTSPGSNAETMGTPVVAGDGTIYVGGRHLYALRPDGTLKWDYPAPGFTITTPERMVTTPAIGLDGTIFAASQHGTLVAIVELEESNGGFASAPWPKARGDRANTGRVGGS